MNLLDRITGDPLVMGGRPCIRGMRVTVGTIVELLAAGRSHEEVLNAYPYVEVCRRGSHVVMQRRTDPWLRHGSHP
jgi:uncharacterized protein (DUF433 family)